MNWIKIDKQKGLPCYEDGDVLATDGRSIQVCSFFLRTTDNKHWYEGEDEWILFKDTNEGNPYGDVTHWMKLPPLPQEMATYDKELQ